MNTPLSLVQELRGLRNGPKQAQSEAEGLLMEVREAQREWKTEIDQAHRILRDLLMAISALSGVDIPELALESDGKPAESLIRLDFKTVKDRIRNDLEASAAASAAEIVKQAQEKGIGSLDGLEAETNARLDSLADEFHKRAQARIESEQVHVSDDARKKIQQMIQTTMDDFSQWIKLMTEGVETTVSAKVEATLDPHVREASSKLLSSFRQEMQCMFQEQERLARVRIQELSGEINQRIDGLGEQARNSCSQSAQESLKSFAERFSAAEETAIQQTTAKMDSATQKSVEAFQQTLHSVAGSLAEEAARHQAAQSEEFRQQIEKINREFREKNAAEIAEQTKNATTAAFEATIQQLDSKMEVTLETSKNQLSLEVASMMEDIRARVAGAAQSACESVARHAQEHEESVRKVREQLKAAEEEHVASSATRLSGLSDRALNSMTVKIKEIAEAQVKQLHATLQEFESKVTAGYDQRLQQAIESHHQAALDRLRSETEEAAARASAEIKRNSEHIAMEISERVNKEVNASTSLLKQWALQTTAWAESSVKTSLDTYKDQLAHVTDEALAEQRESIHLKIGSLQSRLEQAARLLHEPDYGMAASSNGGRTARSS